MGTKGLETETQTKAAAQEVMNLADFLIGEIK